VHLAIKGPAPAAAPQAQRPSPGIEGASPIPHADFSQMLTEQAGLGIDRKLASGVPPSIPVPAEADSGEAAGQVPHPSSTGDTEMNHSDATARTSLAGPATTSLTKGLMAFGLHESQSDPGLPTPSVVPKGARDSNSPGSTDDTGKGDAVTKSKEHRHDEQIVAPIASQATVAFATSADVFAPLLPTGTALLQPPPAETSADPQPAAITKAPSSDVHPARGIEAAGANVSLPATPADGSVPMRNNGNLVPSLGDSRAGEISAAQAPREVPIPDAPRVAEKDPKRLVAGGVASPAASTSTSSSASASAAVQAVGQPVHGEVKAELSLPVHAGAGEHAPSGQPAMVLPQAPNGAMPNGDHSTVSRVSTDFLRGPAGVENNSVSGNPYQRLDQGPSASPVVFSSSATRMVVGVHDPALGWVEVKTQSTAGQVSAALVTSSSQTHESLSAQLPSLTQFLAEREVKVGDLVVQQHLAGGGDHGRSGSGDAHGAASQQQQQSRGDGSGFTADSRAGDSSLHDSSFNDSSLIDSPSGAGIRATGGISEERPLSYISVRA
jgi:Flagellar hook-length control protein FliK